MNFEYKYNRATQNISIEIKQFDKTIFVEESGCSIKPEIEISEEEAKNLRLQAKIETQIDFESLIAEGYSEKYLDLIVKTILKLKAKHQTAKVKFQVLAYPQRKLLTSLTL